MLREFFFQAKLVIMDILQKLKIGIAPVDSFVKKFIYTDYYMWLILAIVFIGWVARSATFGFVALILTSCFVLLFADDILPLIVNILSAVLMIFTDTIDAFLYMWPTFIPLGLAIAVFVVRNVRIKVKTPGEKFHLGKMFFPRLAVALALLLGGVGVVSVEGYLMALPNTIALGIGVLAVYLLVRNFLKTGGDLDRSVYFAKILAYVGMVVGLQLVIVIARAGIAPAHWAGANWNVGWGNRNNVATYLIFTAPMCLFLGTKHRYGVIYLFMAVFQYCCLIMTFSRGGILFGAIAAVFGVAFTIWKSKDRKRQAIYVGGVFAVMALFYLIFMDDVNDVFKSLMSRGTGLSGRDELYVEAWDLFKQKPFQGHGLGYMGNGPGGVHEAINLYWFHSTFFQVIACMGIIGILAYGYNYVVKFMLLLKNWRNSFNLFVLVIFIGFEGYSMMDTGTMVPFPNMMLVVILMCVVEMFTSDRDTVTFDKLCETEVYTRETAPAVEEESGEELALVEA